jgi:hypothetical protein
MLTPLRAPPTAPLTAPRSAFTSWMAHFSDLPTPITSRALHMWSDLTGWLQQHAPFVAESLVAGATLEEVEAAEADLGVKLPPALSAILRVHNGQSLSFDSVFDRYVTWRMMTQEGDESSDPPSQPPRWHPSMVWGLFGGYSFYDHMASLRLFPLERVVRWTQFFRSHVVSGAWGVGGGRSWCAVLVAVEAA